MRFSLLFPLMLLGLGTATLLGGNVPARAAAPPSPVIVGPVIAGPAPAGPELAVPKPAVPKPAGPPPDRAAAPNETASSAATPAVFYMPVDGVSVTDVPSSFGDPRGDDRLHEGIDIMAPRGTPVRAAASGTVRRVSRSARGGLSVTVSGDDGLRYFYTHFDSFAAGLAEGDRVGVDSVIGYVGNSGNAAATAPHLHFGVYRPTGQGRYSWQAFDPLPHLIDRASDAS